VIQGTSNLHLLVALISVLAKLQVVGLGVSSSAR